MTDQHSNNPDRDRLRSHFSVPTETHGEQWEKLWEGGDWLPWDKGFPNPALIDTLNDKQDIIGKPGSKSPRQRALVPGCGKGYDVLLLASYGYDAFGLEISETAVRDCRKFAEQVDVSKDYPVKDEAVGRGAVTFLHGDFFKDAWLKEAGDNRTFELIYDYTFLCALPPEVRPNWAMRMSTLLSPSGHLICLEFPLYKPPETGGPPWALREETYVQHLSQPGEKVPYDEQGFIVNEQPPKTHERALVRIARWWAERSHAIGQGTDHISIWRHK